MAKQIQLKAKPRVEVGKNLLKRLRSEGSIPAIVYGVHIEPVAISVNGKDFEYALHHASSENVLVDLQVEENGASQNRLALIQEVQHHPVTDNILHVDFHEVSMTEKLRTVVPIHTIGEPIGVKTGGGVLEHIMRELKVECLPADLPESIDVNIEALEVGVSFHVREFQLPKGVVVLDQPDQVVFTVAAPLTESDTGEVTGSVEPEVIGAKKEEGAPAAGKGDAKSGGSGKPDSKK